jgi:hypothetical protein
MDFLELLLVLSQIKVVPRLVTKEVRIELSVKLCKPGVPF